MNEEGNRSAGRQAVLAVDDMGINLKTVKMALDKDFEVRLAKSGELALSIITTKKIDLILLDIQMPEMSGFEFIERMRHIPNLEKTPPVIFVTGFLNPDLLAQAKTAGAAGYILKPFDPENLRKKVGAVLGGASPGDLFDAADREGIQNP